MFDIGASELLVIGVVALLVIGPRELPGVLRSAGRSLNKLRAMAGEFRAQFDDAMREAELHEARKQFDDINKAASSMTDVGSFNPIQTIRNELSGAIESAKAGVEKTMITPEDRPDARSIDADQPDGCTDATLGSTPGPSDRGADAAVPEGGETRKTEGVA